MWGAADAVFHDGVAGLTGGTDEEHVAGVQPLDRAVGRRPGGARTPVAVRAASITSITRLPFPDRAPDLPDALHVNGEPMDPAYVVGVLLGNRDLERRLAAENAGNAENAGRLVAVA